MGSQVILEQKQAVVAEVTEKLQNASSAIVVDYQGLTVAEVTELRRKLREAGAEIRVFKNSITRRAAENVGVSELSEFLVGPNAVAFGAEDVVAPAKILSEFAKKHNALEIKAGIVEGKFAPLATITDLASIPSREGLLTMLAGAMLAPLREVAVGLNMISEQMEEATAE